ncbi:MAG: cysteine hydrolase [Desulfurococcales archaeon]|nr:cysteine hydrolase [Desulfurococcales archaeon]
MVKVDVPGIKIEDKVILPAKETAVIVVDMQNDFVKEGGKLVAPAAEGTVEPIRRLLKKARENGVRVIYTQDTHWEGDPEFLLWGEHVKYGSWGWRIIDELKPEEGDIVLVKTRYDGFYGTPMDDILRSYGYQNIVIVGTVANICVLHTAASAGLRWYKILIPMDGISALTEFDYYLTLRQVSWLYNGLIVKTVNSIEFK